MKDEAIWISIAVAVLAIVVTVWATRRWGNRRARLQLALEVVPLLPEDHPTSLAVTFVGVLVPNPHLFTFELRNIGPRDVPSSAFDNQEPVKVRFASTFFGVTQSTGGGDLVAPAMGSSPPEAVVMFMPRLLKRNDAWSFTAVVSGVELPEVENSLVDTDLVVASPSGSDLILTIPSGFFGFSVDVPVPRASDVVRKLLSWK